MSFIEMRDFRGRNQFGVDIRNPALPMQIGKCLLQVANTAQQHAPC